VPDPDDPLVNQHTKSIERETSAGFSVADQQCSRRIGDDIGNDHPGTQATHLKIKTAFHIRK
jgi:hypothetical protein